MQRLNKLLYIIILYFHLFSIKKITIEDKQYKKVTKNSTANNFICQSLNLPHFIDLHRDLMPDLIRDLIQGLSVNLPRDLPLDLPVEPPLDLPVELFS